jgi:hypothetical protein
MLWERVVTSFDLLVGSLDFWGFKWRLADKLSVTELCKGYMMTPTDQTSTSYECPFPSNISGAI